MLSSVTDEQGRYEFTGLPPNGVYTLKVSADGFEELTENADIAAGAVIVRDFSLHITTVVQSTTVREQVEDIQTASTASPAKVTSKEIEDLPLTKQSMGAVLASPVVPGVVQTANGVLNIKGAVENQGMLLVDSMETTNPVTGRFSIPVPLDAIQSVAVMETAYNAEYGGFSGGLTKIQTKPPLDHWQFGLNDFMPGFRGKNGHLRGLADEDPRLFVTGPVLKDKLNVTQILSYQFDRPTVRGLAWPYNETITRGAGSMTMLQATLSERHIVNVSANVFSHRVQFADINANLPQSASSNNAQHGFWLGGNDSYQFASGMLLNTSLRYTRVDSVVSGQGAEVMHITSRGWGGNYFNSLSREGDQFQALSSLQLPLYNWHGRHAVKMGVDFTRRSFFGTTVSHSVELLGEGGLPVEQLAFEGAGRLRGDDSEISEFIEDHWSATDRLTFDAGTRLTSQSDGRGAAFAPRVAAAYSLGSDRKTVIRSGAGFFYGHIPLLSTDFTDNLTRVITMFDANGQITGTPIRYDNRYLEPVAGGGFTPTNDPLSKAARNFTWNVEVERELRRNLHLRVNYLQSQTRDLPVVMPLSPSVLTGGEYVLGLASTGSSRYHGTEVTMHYQGNQRRQLNISYLHSSARGDINTLSGIYTPLEQPVIRANVHGVLPADVPNRVVAWGTFGLPFFQLVVTPLADIHTGLPYSVVDASQDYVGEPNTGRFPRYFSLDMQIYREFQLSSFPGLHNVKNRSVRIGVLAFDLTGHQNPNAVFNTITSPNFGRFAGFSRRIDGFVLEFH